MQNTTHEQHIATFYDTWWSTLLRFWDVHETLCLHHGFFEPGIHSFKDAVLNMNNLVGQLIGLDTTQKHMHILDAGCGVGGISMYLAQRYPAVSFTGITVASEQIKIASYFSKKNDLSNVEFHKENYLKTGFSDEFFDAIFAVESASYASSFKDFIDEMYRVLKPGGRLVIIDGFLQKTPTNDFLKKRYDSFCQGLGGLFFPNKDQAVSYLKMKGFSDVHMQNISKNIRPSFFAHTVVGLPFFITVSLKNILHLSFKKSLLPSSHAIRGTSIDAAFLVFNNIIGYYTLQAVKKSRH